MKNTSKSKKLAAEYKRLYAEYVRGANWLGPALKRLMAEWRAEREAAEVKGRSL